MYNNIKKNKVWYLLLQLGVPVPFNDKSIKRHLRIVRKECKNLKVFIRAILINHGENYGRYLFRFPYYKKNDMSAVKFAESFLYGLTYLHGPIIDSDHDSLILCIPDNIIRGRNEISNSELIEFEESRDFEDRTLDFPHSTIGSYYTTSVSIYEAAWRIVSVLFKNNNLFEATRYIKRSYESFYVMPGQRREVIDDDSTPISGSDKTRYEDALQNAFKAIEAIIGDPPSNNRKFFRKLKEIGLNPFEEVGYTEKKPLHEDIREINYMRDKKSAHGSTKNRKIKTCDLFRYQSCAFHILRSAIETARGSSIY